MSAFALRPLGAADAAWVARHIAEQWGSEIAVAHGAIYRPAELPGFVAEADGEAVGLLTYHIDGARARSSPSTASAQARGSARR